VQEFTRVRIDEHFLPIDLNAVIESVIEFTRPAWMTNAKKRGVSVHVHQRLGATRHVEGNASELREVFTNLVLNALDAMPWGGHLYVATEDAGDHVIARFRDTGVGMDEDTRSRVFDPFFTTKAVQGTGLGLSVAYGIVARHRGVIDVESERGVGTEFKVTLPATLAVATPPEAPVPIGPLPSRAILAIDDEESVLDVIADMLRTLGQEVTVAVGGEAGLTAVDLLRPQIVFTDLGMPDVNGWEVAQHVRAQRPDAVLVMVTGWGFQLEEDAAQQRGVDLILTKPFTFEDVERALGHVMELLERRKAA
jgi:CheY-like chemotaxis protein